MASLLRSDYDCQKSLLTPIYPKFMADADQAARRGLMLTAAHMQVVILVTCMKPTLTNFLLAYLYLSNMQTGHRRTPTFDVGTWDFSSRLQANAQSNPNPTRSGRRLIFYLL